MKKTLLLFIGLAFSVIINAQTQDSLQTTFAQGNQLNGAMFVLLNTSSNYISIDGFDVLINDSAMSFPVAVFYKTNRYIGYEQDSLSWVLLQNDTISSMGNNYPTYIELNNPKMFGPDDSLAFYITTPPSTHYVKYTNGNTIYSNADLSFIPGAGKSAYFGSATYSSRILNAIIHYHLVGDQQPITNDTLICQGDSVLLQTSAPEAQGFEWDDGINPGQLSLTDSYLTGNLMDTTMFFIKSINNYFYDNAEDNNINEITTSTGFFSTTTDQSVSGDYSLKCDGSYSSGGLADHIELNGVNPNYISWNVFPTTAGASQGLLALEDGVTTSTSNQLIWAYIYQGTDLKIIGATTAQTAISLNQWYKVELKNINYETQTFDVWVNGMLNTSDVGFRGNVKNIDRIYLGNYHSAVSYYDDIVVGNVIYSPYDTATVFTQICTGITENGLKYNSKIYPNPTYDVLTIETQTEAKNVNYILTDLTGKVIISKNNISNYEQIDLSGLQSGIYLIKIIYDGKVETKKIVKE